MAEDGLSQQMPPIGKKRWYHILAESAAAPQVVDAGAEEAEAARLAAEESEAARLAAEKAEAARLADEKAEDRQLAGEDEKQGHLRFLWTERRWWRLIPIVMVSALIIAPIGMIGVASFLFGGRYKISLSDVEDWDNVILDVQGCAVTWTYEHVSACEDESEWSAGWDSDAPWNPAACGATIQSYQLWADFTHGHFYAPSEDDEDCPDGCIGVNYIVKDIFGKSNPSFGPWQGESGVYAASSMFRPLNFDAPLANGPGVKDSDNPVQGNTISIKPQSQIVGLTYSGAVTEDTFTSPGYCFVTLPNNARRRPPVNLNLVVNGAFKTKTKLFAEGHLPGSSPRTISITADDVQSGEVLVDMHDVDLDSFSIRASAARLQMTNVSVESLDAEIGVGYADISTSRTTTLAAATAGDRRCATGATVTAFSELGALEVSNGIDAPSQTFNIHVADGDFGVNVWGKLEAMGSVAVPGSTISQDRLTASPGRYHYQKFDSEYNRTLRKRVLKFDPDEMKGINLAAADSSIEIVDMRVGGSGYLPMMTMGQLAGGQQGYAADNVFGFQLPMRTGPFGMSRRPPFNFHADPVSYSAFSLGQLLPKRKHFDLSMRTGFCPTFHKRTPSCPAAADLAFGAATLSTCSSDHEDELLERKYRFECAPTTHTGGVVISTLLCVLHCTLLQLRLVASKSCACELLLSATMVFWIRNPDAYCSINNPLDEGSTISLQQQFTVEKAVFTAARVDGLDEALEEENGIQMYWGLEWQELMWGTFHYDPVDQSTSLQSTSKEMALIGALSGIVFIGSTCLAFVLIYMGYRALRSHLIEYKLDLLFSDELVCPIILRLTAAMKHENKGGIHRGCLCCKSKKPKPPSTKMLVNDAWVRAAESYVLEKWAQQKAAVYMLDLSASAANDEVAIFDDRNFMVSTENIYEAIRRLRLLTTVANFASFMDAIHTQMRPQVDSTDAVPRRSPSIPEVLYWRGSHPVIAELYSVLAQVVYINVPPLILSLCFSSLAATDIAFNWGNPSYVIGMIVQFSFTFFFMPFVYFSANCFRTTGYEVPAGKLLCCQPRSYTGKKQATTFEFFKKEVWRERGRYFGMKFLGGISMLIFVCAFIAILVFVQLTLVSIFVYPTSSLPVAGMISGVVGQAVSLRRKLFGWYDMVVEEVRAGISSIDELLPLLNFAGLESVAEAAKDKLAHIDAKLEAAGDNPSGVVSAEKIKHILRDSTGKDKELIATFSRPEVDMRELKELLREFGISKEMLIGTIVGASLTLALLSSVLIVAVFASTGGKSDSASTLTTGLIGAISILSNRANDRSTNQLNFEKLKARVLKKYYENKIKHGEQRFRYKLDEDASTTLKNALDHQKRKAAGTLSKGDNALRSQRSWEDATEAQSHQPLPGEVTPGHDES